MNKIIIGFTGEKGVGKTTAADFFSKNGYKKISINDKVKEFASYLFSDTNVEEEMDAVLFEVRKRGYSVNKDYWNWVASHGRDAAHPNFRAQYLLASCVYAAITGNSPVGLPHELKTFPCYDTAFHDSFALTANEARTLQEAAWKAVCEEKELAKSKDYGLEKPGGRAAKRRGRD